MDKEKLEEDYKYDNTVKVITYIFIKVDSYLTSGSPLCVVWKDIWYKVNFKNTNLKLSQQLLKQ